MTYDLAIIGGGPAGVGAGVYASRKRLKTVFITKDFHGQSVVSDGIENWIGSIRIPGLELAKNLENHLKAYAGEFVDVKEGEICTALKQNKDKIFEVKTDKAEYRSKTVLITTGSHRRKLQVEGADTFEHKGLTYCASCDGPMFAGQDVAVVGGGNAAFETAAQLLAYCKSVTLLDAAPTFKADQITIDKLKANKKFQTINNAQIKEIIGDKFVNGIIYNDGKKDITLHVTGIFVEIGAMPTTEFTKELVALNKYGQIVVDARNQRTSVEGIWAAGDCTDGLYHQNNIATGDAVKALEDVYVALKTR